MGGCTDGEALHHPGIAFPFFNDLGLILPFFAFFFFLLTPPQSLALESYYCLCRSVPGHPHWQMLDLKSMDEKLSRHICARDGGVCLCQGAGGPPSLAQPPQSCIAPEDISLGNSLKINKKKYWTKTPTNNKKRTTNNYQESFLKSPLQKKGKGGGKTGSIFLPGPNTADLLAQEMHSW